MSGAAGIPTVHGGEEVNTYHYVVHPQPVAERGLHPGLVHRSDPCLHLTPGPLLAQEHPTDRSPSPTPASLRRSPAGWAVVR
jgi:hypothetical protein